MRALPSLIRCCLDFLAIFYSLSVCDYVYNLINDPEEKLNVYNKFPEIAKQMEELADKARFELGDRLTGVEGVENRELGK